MEFVDCAGIEVAHNDTLDGGGPRTWPYFVQHVREHVGTVNRAYEWCSGPGYIGFALLGAGLCQRLTLADINPVAVQMCNETIKRNNLEDRVSVYLSNNLADIPASERWDLVVGDPPHFKQALTRHIEDGFKLRSVDEDWKLHKDFFATLEPHLTPGARVLLSESRAAGDHDEFFMNLMRSAGLEITEPVWDHGYNQRYCILGQYTRKTTPAASN